VATDGPYRFIATLGNAGAEVAFRIDPADPTASRRPRSTASRARARCSPRCSRSYRAPRSASASYATWSRTGHSSDR
jgi:hypothetical protein